MNGCVLYHRLSSIMRFLYVDFVGSGRVCFFFFFSSRRRHTRCLSDWSSDVCSSDLCAVSTAAAVSRPVVPRREPRGPVLLRRRLLPREERRDAAPSRRRRGRPREEEIGRASCRERV